LQLGKVSKTWVMPSLTFFESYANGEIDISYIDTTPMYYGKEQLQAEFSTDFSNSTAQVESILEKLEDRLKNTEASWKIVVGHHPLFSTGSHFVEEPQCLERMQKLLKPILEKYKVAAYICGHEHSVQHSVVDGVHYFVTGAGSKIQEITAHIKENRFGMGKQGFIAYAFEKDILHAYVVDLAGVVMYEAQVERPN